MGLFDVYEVETEDGPALRRPVNSLLDVAALATGMVCPKCGAHAKLFIGDPNGEHWCIACEVIRNFGEVESEANREK